MQRLNRYLTLLFSFLVACSSLSFLFLLLNVNSASNLVSFLYHLTADPNRQLALLVLTGLLFVVAFSSFLYLLLQRGLNKALLKENEIGSIDIGVSAIEHIALNAAKAAQAGIKSAKARVYPAKHHQLRLMMTVQLYSDVEIPSQMQKIQDRVKKDVERYTGMQVAKVQIKVSQVELVGAKIER